MQEIISDLAALAGLFHDIGKSTAGFQKKLADRCAKTAAVEASGDPIKHDLMGVLMLEHWLSSFGDLRSIDDRSWLQVMESPKDFSKSMGKVFKKTALVPDSVLKVYHNDNEEHPVRSLQVISDTRHPNFLKSAVRYALLFLVLSHHRLPANKLKKGDHYPVYSSVFVNTSTKLSKQWSQVPTGCVPLWGDSESRWVADVAHYASRILGRIEALREALAGSTDAGAGFVTAITQIARCGLIQADFMVSSEAWHEPERRWADSAVGWANTIRNERPGQRLDDHLIRVGRMAPACVANLFSKGPSITRDIDTLSNDSLPEEFMWQVAGEQLLSSHEEPDGLIVFLMAGTGSGKTIGAGRFLKAVSPNGLRFNFVTGLRTLTLQTADSYRKDLGLRDDELATVIGCDVELAIKRAEAKVGLNGTHHGLDAETDQVVLAGRGFSKLEDRMRIFRDIPLVVSTVDSMIDSVLGSRNTGALSSIRVSNSDFILDEIDSYSENDLVGISKLVYFIGFCGRKVIISSATTTPEIAEIMAFAYMSGFRAGVAYRGECAKVNVAWISEDVASNRFASDVSESTFRELHNEYAKRMIASLVQKAPVRIPRMVPISDCSSLESAYKCIETACISMHEQNHEVDPLSGKRFSFGLVRLSTVEACKEFSLFLSQSQNFPRHRTKICCYHSQQMVGYQHCLEAFYNRVLKRKPRRGLPAIFEHPEVIEGIAESDSNDVLFIMVSSPIEEVGRDHDFDWGIVEPTSMRAIIQTAGRIRRHRGVGAGARNLGILSMPFRAFLGIKERIYAFPGPETPNGIDDNVFKSFNKESRTMLSFSVLENVVDARDCICPTAAVKSELARRERVVQKLHFEPTTDAPGNLNAKSYFEQPALRFGCSHNDFFKFRGDNLSYSYAKVNDGDWRLKRDGDDMQGSFNNLVDELMVFGDRWLYIPTDREVDERYRKVFSNMNDEEYRKIMYVVSVQVYGPDQDVPRIGFSPETGGFKTKEKAA